MSNELFPWKPCRFCGQGPSIYVLDVDLYELHDECGKHSEMRCTDMEVLRIKWNERQDENA